MNKPLSFFPETNRLIKVTGVDVRELISKIYDMSVPQGMGFLHFQPGPIDQETLQSCEDFLRNNKSLHLNYVNGRACKMHIELIQGDLYVSDYWYDHSHTQFCELFESLGFENPTKILLERELGKKFEEVGDAGLAFKLTLEKAKDAVISDGWYIRIDSERGHISSFASEDLFRSTETRMLMRIVADSMVNTECGKSSVTSVSPFGVTDTTVVDGLIEIDANGLRELPNPPEFNACSDTPFDPTRYRK